MTDFQVDDLVTPNYKGIQWGWPKGYEAKVIQVDDKYGMITIQWLTEEDEVPFDGQRVDAHRSYRTDPMYFKKVRVTKASVDAAIKSIMSRQ